MSPAIVILSPADLPAAAQIAARLDGHELLVFDPVLIDAVAEAGLGAARWLQWDAAPPFARLPAEAHHQAHALGAQLDAVAEPLWPGLGLGSWQHLNLYYLHMALAWYAPLFAALVPQLAGRTLHVPLCDAPQHFYFPSFVPALLLLLAAQRSGIAFQAYSFPGPADPGPQVPALHGSPAPPRGPFLLAHLPTCFYDIGHFDAEIAAAGMAVVNLRAPRWDVPVRADTTVDAVPAAGMRGAVPVAALARVDAVTAALAEVLDRHLAPWLAAPAYRRRQTAHLRAGFEAQLLSLVLLNQHFAATPPRRLLLSDHDCGLHGPLCAFARQHQRPTVVLPHSRTSADIEFLPHDATVVHHAIQGGAVHDLAQRRPAQHAIDYPLALRWNTAPTGTVRTVGLLLNGVALNGVPGADLAPWLLGIAEIADWCRAQGVELLVRSRPGQSLRQLLVARCGLDAAQMAASVQGTMAAFAERCDLCLMYDAPTSGALELLARGIPLLNPVASGLTRRERATVDEQVVPRAATAASLARAAELLADPLEFERFRKQQMLALMQSLATARPLRSFF